MSLIGVAVLPQKLNSGPREEARVYMAYAMLPSRCPQMAALTTTLILLASLIALFGGIHIRCSSWLQANRARNTANKTAF